LCFSNQLESEWHNVSFRVKQLIEDLGTLRRLLDNLLRYDAVTFYTNLLTLQTANMANMQKSADSMSVLLRLLLLSSNILLYSLSAFRWLGTEAADQLFAKSKSRVFGLRRIVAQRESEVHFLQNRYFSTCGLLTVCCRSLRQNILNCNDI